MTGTHLESSKKITSHVIPEDSDIFNYSPDANSKTKSSITTNTNFQQSNKSQNNSSELTRCQPENPSSLLLATDVLPYSQRSVFPFKQFNKMQSKAFSSIYNTSNNCVISSPTGSGKTVLFELAILREIGQEFEPNFKVLYLAPTKALCSERLNDWTKKFSLLNITVGILTGDTTFKEAENVRKSNIIVSTPEKWDMITRKWKDYSRLFGLIKLLLVDEIHILKESRGSTLEVVMTRMKRICIGLRILAISATVANAIDISKWIRLHDESTLPAETMCFGEEFRPVKLSKIVYGYKSTSENDFQFDIFLNTKLLEVINRHSNDKSVLIFCSTRNSCQATAKFLFNNLPEASRTDIKLKDRDAMNYTTRGIAFHHAGLTFGDRKQIETAFLNSRLKILCCTSTLAVGINLPAYLVVIKGTKCWVESSFQEYSETDILQMVGRAGRPQFESDGVAVIMTSSKWKHRYERIIEGTEKIESSLHMNFREHLAAEISVGVIKNIDDSLAWLKSTYLYVRFLANPGYYALQIPKTRDPEDTLTSFCFQQCKALAQENLVTMDEQNNCKITAYGYSMVMHYITFNTMKNLIHSQGQLSVYETLCLICESSEFADLNLKHQEKRLYKEINGSPILRYPSKSKDLGKKDKIKLIIQFELGGLDFPAYNGALKLHSSFLGDKFYVFKHIYRIMMALLDVFIEKQDAKSLHSSSYLLRCVNGKCWEDSPNELRQLDGIGPASVKKFCTHNILSLNDAKALTSSQIEYFLGLKTGAGNKIKRNIASLPNLQLNIEFENEELAEDRTSVEITLNISIDVVNASTTSVWKNKLVYIHLITDTSNGHLLDFRRIPVSKFKTSGLKTFELSYPTKDLNEVIRCQASADTIASVKTNTSMSIYTHLSESTIKDFANNTDDFEFSESDEDDLFNLKTKNQDESKVIELRNETRGENPKSEVSKPTANEIKTRKVLANGNYECNHVCKDKQKCRHLCCREGLPPKASGGNKNPENEITTPLNSNVQENPIGIGDKAANQKTTQASAKKQLKIRKNKVTLKRTLFDDSDPEEIVSPIETTQSTMKPKKKTKSTVFSIDDGGNYENGEIVHGMKTGQDGGTLSAIPKESIQLETKNKVIPKNQGNSPESFLIETSANQNESLSSLDVEDIRSKEDDSSQNVSVQICNSTSESKDAITDLNKNEQRKIYNKEELQNLLGLDIDIDL
ncbi:ATP-dependent DNA helicase, putative [Candida dubliniensis CD36]|uniref:DNA 3'-5' helicase n=1 Tax=Candida dubliniensis (strain CD36 / ATCC MYA-646 / CBS 7987 / NCPF 3949 / NRRL Y-17841) TaxID=573826 RepID=B9WB85_CANDC|nr:ATP-dependent DNA helicase, putative [Candida dubliniensis CD36]CAX43655.1 ATP-dependent DNA helicase, putative [Candida dubliniensis CD36]